ncbi:MAG TPA: Bax inhibitor-1 family protein [Methylophilus sp.]|uniref:Bax inhibitor-1 family protein n=1 Tax=Methylophilus sp. TaxID=29541 RepID=UPI002B55A13A|nr:Bax inhibitor-1 family protein [Methylophilus sp.]HSH87093.1 Bax inhibitor-1 family protein [Methylophilus sp.]
MSDMQVLGREGKVSDTQNRVLRNTYALLGLSMIPTVIGAYIGLQMNFGFLAAHPFIFAIGFLAVMFGMFKLIAVNQNSSIGVWLLLAMTFAFGIMLGPILQYALHLRNGAEIVGLAAAGTGITFLTLAGIGSSPARDFSGMGKFLMVGLILAIVAGLANLYFQIPALSLAISGVSVLIFSAYILYDVNQIVRGGQTNYVMATLNLYLDVYNLFVNLLNILLALLGNRD